MMTMLRRLARMALFITLLVVLVLALLPTPQLPPLPEWDKGNHAMAFATLSVLAQLAYPGHIGRTQWGLLAFGVLIELLQAFTPTRSADWHDVVADAVGLLAGMVLTLLARHWHHSTIARGMQG